MNRKIKKYRAIEYIILFYAAVLMLLIGPLGIFDGSREVSGNENVQGKTAAVTQDARIQQVFIGDGGYLEKISIYAIQNLSRRVVSLTISDELGETVFSRRVALDTYEAPGFFTIPVEFQTVQGLCMGNQPSGRGGGAGVSADCGCRYRCVWQLLFHGQRSED